MKEITWKEFVRAAAWLALLIINTNREDEGR